MAISTNTYANPATITWTTLNSLASSNVAGAACLALVNTALGYLDDWLNLGIKLGTAPSGGFTNDLFVALIASADGTNYASPVANGTDQAITLFQAPNWDILQSGMQVQGTGWFYTGRLYTRGHATGDVVWGNFALAEAFNGSIPLKFQVFLMNSSGAALAASGHTINYSGLTVTTV